MINYHPMSLGDKSSFDRILAGLQPETSDLTFTNLFMWQHSYGLQVYYDPEIDFWLLFAKPPTPKWKPFFLPPIGDWSNPVKLGKALAIMEQTMRSEKCELRIRRSPGRLVEAMHKIDPQIASKEERYTFDYLYRTVDLINLAGRKLHSKRNHFNQFLRKYQWEFQPINPELAAACLEIHDDWFNISNHQNLNDEEWAMSVIFQNYEALKVIGGVIKIEGQIQAIAVGEMLNNNTAVIHIEKANTLFDGIYVAINNQFADYGWKNTEFINREEDMGLEGLRKSKLSYHPFQLIEKFSIHKKV